MSGAYRPHVLGIDDGPFEKHVSDSTPIVGVVMEGADLVEGVALSRFPVDGDGVTDFLADWIAALRFRPGLQGVVLGGITIAGLCVVDIEGLARRTDLPVVVANRRAPSSEPLCRALETAGFPSRVALVERTPVARPVSAGLFAAQAGADAAFAQRLLRATRAKSEMPEPLRLAHMIARAVATGESRGRP